MKHISVAHFTSGPDKGDIEVNLATAGIHAREDWDRVRKSIAAITATTNVRLDYAGVIRLKVNTGNMSPENSTKAITHVVGQIRGIVAAKVRRIEKELAKA